MITHLIKLRTILIVGFTLLSTNSAYAYPTGGWGWSTWLGGSHLTILWETTDDNGQATLQLNYFEAQKRLCISGEVRAIYNHGTLTGNAVYELLGPNDGDSTTADTQGICYSYVSQTSTEITEDADGNPIDIGIGKAYDVEYIVPSLADIVNDSTKSLAELLTGRMKVVPGTGTDHLALCTPDPTDPNAPPAPEICDFLVGIGFNGDIPPTFFPATVTTNGDSVDPNVVLYSNEICIEHGVADLGLVPSFATQAKSEKLRTCEALAIKGDWCSDLQNQGTPTCDTVNADGQLTTGGFNNVAGDFLKQQDFNVVCMDDVNALRNLGCGEVNLAACSDGNGLIEMPSEFTTGGTCTGINPIYLSFSSSDGGGQENINVTSILNYGSPGYPGDSNTPQCTSACITSTPNNTEINTWGYSLTYLFGIGYIDGQGGDDNITGSKGPDTIRGSSGVDTLDGYLGDDVLLGGANDDTLIGGEDNDLLIGYDCFGPNSDCSVALNNGSDGDTLTGGLGNDCSDGGRGNDLHDLSDGGNDIVIAWGNTDNDTITGITPGDYIPNEPPADDVDYILNLTGDTSLVVEHVKGKGKDAVSYCRMLTGGGDEFLFPEFDNSKTLCESIRVLSPEQAPEQCLGHAYFQ